MKRSAPPKRKTPLKRSTKPIARSRVKRKPAPPGFPEEVKGRVRRRSQNRCEAQLGGCTGKAEHFHHRKLRRHGDHSMENCLHVCAACHTGPNGIHMNTGRSYLMGLLVRSAFDPAQVPYRRGDASALNG